MLNMPVLATLYIKCCIHETKQPKVRVKACTDNCPNWARRPEKIMVGKGTELGKEFVEMSGHLGIQQRVIPVEAPRQHGMVERHSQVLADIVRAITRATSVVGQDQMMDVLRYAALSKHRRPGRTGYNPISLMFGLGERLIAKGLNHYLPTPEDASMTRGSTTTYLTRGMIYRTTAMKSFIGLDHSDKWKEANKYPSRPLDAKFCLSKRRHLSLEEKVAGTPGRNTD